MAARGFLIVGGGYGGMHTALRLERLLRPGEATVTVADPRPYMTYQPLLAEAAAGNLEPRHVVVPLRGVLHRTQVIKDFRDTLHVIATAPSHLAPIPDREEKEAEQHAYHR